MSNLGRQHPEGVKWLICYIKGTDECSLCFRRSGVVFEGFADAELGGYADSGKSKLCYVFKIADTTIS